MCAQGEVETLWCLAFNSFPLFLLKKLRAVLIFEDLKIRHYLFVCGVYPSAIRCQGTTYTNRFSPCAVWVPGDLILTTRLSNKPSHLTGPD